MNELLWYTSRATGTVSIVLLTVVECLGLVVASRRPPRATRAAVVMGLHRSLSLGLVVFLLAHVGTAVGETFVSIDLVSAVVPFTSGYERVWVGFGTTAVDLVVAVLVTSVWRHRLPEPLWRAVHWLGLVLWPLAIVHGLLLGTADELGLRLVTLSCAAAGVAAVVWRVATVDPHAETRQRVAHRDWR
ncbi:MAG: ferric reductase-like transmembrane domain-containing protein [Actinomycetota bacterium]|nr:ferric reductase-like transmembrane domain-containing protein [Actinomycetota bacterium]